MSLFKNRPLARICLFFLLGGLSAYPFHANGMLRELALIPLFLLATALLTSLILRKKIGILLVLSILALLLGYALQLLYAKACYTDIREFDSAGIHSIEGEVVAIESLSSTKSVCTLSLSSVNGKEASGKLKLTVYNRDFIPEKNEVISCDVMILSWADAYLYQKGIAAHVATDALPTSITEKKHPITEMVANWKACLQARLYDGMDEDNAALISAILLGQREDLSDATVTAFKRAGLSHLLALSGLHLSIMAMVLLGLLRKLGTPRHLSFLSLLVFSVFYTLIAGFPLSLLRAAGMLLLAELGRLLRLTSDSVTALFVSVAVITLVSPAAIVDVGLALSFLATLGIITAAELFERKKESCPRARRIIKVVGFSVLITLAATLFTLLLSILVFGEISLLSPLSNLVLSPIIYILLAIAPFALAFPTLLNPIVSFLTKTTYGIISFFSAIPGSYISATYPVFVTVVVLFSLLLIVLLIDTHIGKQALKRWLLSGFAVVVITLASCRIYTAGLDYLSYNRVAESEFLLFQSDRTVTVVANGGNDYTARRIKATLSDQHITEIDTLLIPNANKDTPLLITALLDVVLVHRIILCPAPAVYGNAASSVALDHGIELTQMQNGTLSIAGDLTVTVLSDLGLSQSTEGEFFLRLEYQDTRICYAPAGALAIADKIAKEDFTSRSDLLVIGATPSFSGMVNAEGISVDTALIIGNSQTVPSALSERENAVLEPIQYDFRLN